MRVGSVTFGIEESRGETSEYLSPAVLAPPCGRRLLARFSWPPLEAQELSPLQEL